MPEAAAKQPRAACVSTWLGEDMSFAGLRAPLSSLRRAFLALVVNKWSQEEPGKYELCTALARGAGDARGAITVGYKPINGYHPSSCEAGLASTSSESSGYKCRLITY